MNRFALVVAALLIACTHAAVRPYQTAGANGEAVRLAFNADMGTTRVLILADPS